MNITPGKACVLLKIPLELLAEVSDSFYQWQKISRQQVEELKRLIDEYKED